MYLIMFLQNIEKWEIFNKHSYFCIFKKKTEKTDKFILIVYHNNNLINRGITKI